MNSFHVYISFDIREMPPPSSYIHTKNDLKMEMRVLCISWVTRPPLTVQSRTKKKKKNYHFPDLE